MSSKKITQLTSLETSADDDLIAIVDISETDITKQTKKQTKVNLLKEVVSLIGGENHWDDDGSDLTPHAERGIDLGSGSLTTTGTITGDTIAVGTAYTFPTVDGTINQVIKTDGSGVLSWTTPAGGGDVSKVGTPVDNQIGVWTGDGTLEGEAKVTFDGTAFNVDGNITTTGSVDGIDVNGMSGFVILNSGHRNDITGADHSSLVTAVGLNTAKDTNIAHPLVEEAVPSGAVFTDTQLVEADITTMGFTKDVEVDWTVTQAPAVIHATNYTDTGDTTAHASFSQLDYASAGHTGFAPALGADDNYVTDTEKAALHPAVTIGTGNGLSLSTQALSLAAADTDTTGALTDTDWDTFNEKQDAMGEDDNYVTDAEKTNIGNLDTAAYEPIATFAAALGEDDNYVTDTDITLLGNTSGANTGDQDLSALALKAITISTTAPLSGGGNLSADRTLTIPAATSIANGYLSSANWTTFNNKLSNINSESIDELSDADTTTDAPATNEVLKWNGANWVPAAYNYTFAFSIASFTDNEATTQLIGSGEWEATGAITFDMTYSNGPPTAGVVKLSSNGGVSWGSDLTLTSPYLTKDSAEGTDYPNAKDQYVRFQLDVDKGAENDTQYETAIYFRNHIRWGISTKGSGFTEADVEGLSGSAISNDHTRSVALTPGANDYLVFAFPSTYTSIPDGDDYEDDGTSGFKFNNIACAFQSPETVSITNSAGYTENYKVYASYQKNLGSHTLATSTAATQINPLYYGTTEKEDTFLEADIEGLGTNEITNDNTQAWDAVTTGVGEYMLFAFPKRLGDVAFWVGGFEGGFESLETVSVTNANGWTEDYYAWRSTNSNLGETLVETK